ncbi:hypothetical protein INT48_009387, partial [Thamnidium elegans]
RAQDCLDGGYRKTPILQIRNHVYCDSKIIILGLEKYYPEPSLYPKLANGESSEDAARTFTIIFTQLPFKGLGDDFLVDRESVLGRKLDLKMLAGIAPFMRSVILAEYAIAEKTLGSKTWVLYTNFMGEEWVQVNLKATFGHMQKVFGASDRERGQVHRRWAHEAFLKH